MFSAIKHISIHVLYIYPYIYIHYIYKYTYMFISMVVYIEREVRFWSDQF